MILDIFKMGVYFKECEFDLQPIKDYCLHYSQNNPSRQNSNIGGYQSDNFYLKDIEVFKPLHDKFSNEINLYANDICLKDQVLDNAWININEYKDSNMSHTHPISPISGVFYVSVPEDGGDIVFERSDQIVIDYAWYNKNNNHYNSYNATNWTLPAKDNYLYLFPSFLNHRVSYNNNKENKRISISFNCL